MFTEAQKVDIRFYLGYPDIYRQSNPRLENAIEIMGTRPETQQKVEVLLAKLNAVYGTNPGDAGAIDQVLQDAGIKSIESADDKIEYGSTSGNGGSSTAILNSINDYGRQLVSALSSWMGTPICSNVFGKGGYQGDQWTGWSGQSKSPFFLF